MEGNLSSGHMIQGSGSYGGVDLQGSIRVNQNQQHPTSLHQQHHSVPRQGLMVLPSISENFPLTITSAQDGDRTISLADFAKGERGKSAASDDDEPGFTEDASNGHNDPSKGKKGMPWQRVKWTDKMVRLLITVVSYMGVETAVDYGDGIRRKHANLQKRGKWKSVSMVMAERGHHVSPQQCEDKFNDLNKRYKRLNDILGRGTSCQVVERPELLDMMDHLSDKVKEEVRKILSSKHLFYEEMCSYHNGNRLHLPHDPELQHSLRLALRSRDDDESNDVRRHPQDDLNDGDQDAETDDSDEFGGNHALHSDQRATYGMHRHSAKKKKQCQGGEDVSLENCLNSLDCNKAFSSNPQNVRGGRNQVLPEGAKSNLLQNQWIKYCSLQLEEQNLQIQAQMLELEKEKFKWQRFCRKKDRELEIMRLGNERMKLENEHMALELKRKQLAVDHN